jgi:hypothetical protein
MGCPSPFGAFDSVAAAMAVARWHRPHREIIGMARSRSTDTASPHVEQRP